MRKVRRDINLSVAGEKQPQRRIFVPSKLIDFAATSQASNDRLETVLQKSQWALARKEASDSSSFLENMFCRRQKMPEPGCGKSSNSDEKATTTAQI